MNQIYLLTTQLTVSQVIDISFSFTNVSHIQIFNTSFLVISINILDPDFIETSHQMLIFLQQYYDINPFNIHTYLVLYFRLLLFTLLFISFILFGLLLYFLSHGVPVNRVNLIIIPYFHQLFYQQNDSSLVINLNFSSNKLNIN